MYRTVITLEDILIECMLKSIFFVNPILRGIYYISYIINSDIINSGHGLFA